MVNSKQIKPLGVLQSNLEQLAGGTELGFTEGAQNLETRIPHSHGW